METKKFEINIEDHYSATFNVEENHYVTIKFFNRLGRPTDISIAKKPTWLTKALFELKKAMPDYEPKTLLYQSNDLVIYYFKRILWIVSYSTIRLVKNKAFFINSI